MTRRSSPTTARALRVLPWQWTDKRAAPVSYQPFKKSSENYGVPVVSIIQLDHIIDYLQASHNGALQQHLPAVVSYREEYGV